ncbi:response regulator receiver domain protein [Leptospira inadai serovar Lyme str. 10]|uniref:Response regulator receiver domain protein n=2 Tax=Leptospira inadai serovar Lyme TaxID=293084 RepID=V6HCF6_9LEPT|nr:response regulator [Leptospira inadai]EQA37551.1 response regulator receiver domain protein [Leptospira inadai serovar Lyme str. 10]PNV75652.1 response regulator [Leptospira inadai serovar Lyme]
MNSIIKATFDILLVEDNPADVRLTLEALGEAPKSKNLIVVKDGEEALDYVKGEGQYSDSGNSRPDLILLDLNLPRKNGFDVLKELKGDPDLRRIPIVVLTTSGSDRDILQTYNLHANSYIQKPVEFESFIEAMQSLRIYWFQTTTLPPR